MLLEIFLISIFENHRGLSGAHISEYSASNIIFLEDHRHWRLYNRCNDWRHYNRRYDWRLYNRHSYWRLYNRSDNWRGLFLNYWWLYRIYLLILILNCLLRCYEILIVSSRHLRFRFTSTEYTAHL